MGKSLVRKEAWRKVTGEARYTDDFPLAGFYSARMLVSPHAHARIAYIDSREALAMAGVKLVLTGADCPPLSGPLLRDRPLLATDCVRYAGEPVALVVALDEATASLAAEKIRVAYEPLPAVMDAQSALDGHGPLLHPDLAAYVNNAADVYPQTGTNVSSHFPIRKGNVEQGFGQCEAIVSRTFSLAPSGHIAMETRTCRTQILKDGTVEILTASQSPYEVAKQIAECFAIPAGNVRVKVPFVGGAFGGKAPVVLELLAYMASKKLNGHPVRITATRKEDMETLPSRSGFHAHIKLGADQEGILRAAEILFIMDSGAYADISPYMAKAAAVDCTGPYNIENLACDVYSVYTNHTYATSYRGFAHESLTFCIERAMDALSFELKMDPLAFRRLNAIRPGQLTPTQVKTTLSNIGNLESCIDKLISLCGFKSMPEPLGAHIVRAKGCACFWKAPTPPTDAISGAIATVNADGSFNLSTGVVEMGNGGQTLLAQMFADRLKIPTDQVHVNFSVDTRLNPEHYKTVASFSSYIAGRAVMRAADDVIAQIKRNGALAFACAIEDVELDGGRVYLKQDPECYLLYKDVLSGGGPLGEPVIGRGGFMLKGLSLLNPQTGAGRSAPSWTVGAQAVEIEVDTRDCSYKILNAYTVMDVGKALNPLEQEGMIKGGMAMGLSMASREAFEYENGRLTTPSLRTYKLMHFSERPKYHVAFVETPQADSPYGSRSISEHGIIGMAGALANALSSALNISADSLPLTPEKCWQLRNGGNP